MNNKFLFQEIIKTIKDIEVPTKSFRKIVNYYRLNGAKKCTFQKPVFLIQNSLIQNIVPNRIRKIAHF